MLLEVLYVKSKKKHKFRIVRVSNCLGAEMSHTCAELSGCRTVLVPKCLHTGAEVSSIRSLSPENSNWNVVSMKNSVTGMSVNYLGVCLSVNF